MVKKIQKNLKKIEESKKKELLKEASSLSVTGFVSYREYLGELYSKLKTDRNSYSYQQFAEDLGFSKSNVIWLVITGRRKLSTKSCNKIIETLKLKGIEKNYLGLLKDYNEASRPDQREDIFQKLVNLKNESIGSERTQEVLEYYSEWYHPVIREMTGMVNFQSDADWICSQLCVRLLPKQVKRSIELLEKLSLITFDEDQGRHFRTEEQIKPDRNTENMALIRYHQKMSEIARDSITKVKAKRREINALTLCVTDEVAMKMGEIVYKAAEEIMKLEQEVKDGDQVYQLNLQLFPLTEK